MPGFLREQSSGGKSDIETLNWSCPRDGQILRIMWRNVFHPGETSGRCEGGHLWVIEDEEGRAALTEV